MGRDPMWYIQLAFWSLSKSLVWWMGRDPSENECFMCLTKLFIERKDAFQVSALDLLASFRKSTV